MLNRRHPLLALAVAGVLFGLTVPLTKLALGWLGPASVTAVRFALAAPLLAWIGRSGLRAAASLPVVLSGAVGYGGMVLVQNAGVERTSVGHAAVLVGAVPALVAVFATLAGRGVPGAHSWLGFGLALGGVALVAGSGGAASFAGDALVLVSAVSQAAFVVVQSRLLVDRDPVAVTAVQMASAGLVALPLAVLEGAPSTPDAGSAAALAALVVAGTVLPFALFAFGQARVGPEVAGAFVNLEPLVGAAVAVFAFGNPFGVAQGAGTLAILAGIGLSSRVAWPAMDAREAVKQWLDAGLQVVVATVVATRRSAPRPLGSKLAISERGELAGSVSGGCVESDVAEQAREVLASGTPKLVSYGIADEAAWEVGLPCGGEIDVFLERATSELPDPETAQTVLTVLDGPRIGERWIEAGGSRSTGMVELDGEQVFAEALGPPPRLLVFGAVDLAEALCRAAGNLGWRTIVADARGRFATRERIPSADELLVAWPEDVLAEVRPDARTAVVALTHEERWDVPALAGALATEAFYVGALGSRRTQARRREQLLDAGVSEEQLARLHGPAGLDLGAGTPAETALSILAEIVAVRAGREGGTLRTASGAIHAEPALP